MSIPESPLEPIRASRMYQAIMENLVEYIERNHLVAGDPLPPEGVLASGLGVSRPTLRQSLRILEAADVLTIRAGKNGGIVVRSEIIPHDVITTSLESEMFSLESLVRTRHLIEPVIMHLAAENATPEDIESIQHAIGIMPLHEDTPEQIIRSDTMFHRRVAIATHDDILRATANSLYRKLARILAQMHKHNPSVEHMTDIHQRLLDAIKLRDHTLISAMQNETIAGLEDFVCFQPAFDVAWTVRGKREAALAS